MPDPATDTSPDVTVVIPYHNCRELTENCLRSFARHSADVDWELILVDDASTEQPDHGVLAGDPRVSVLRNESRRSYSVNNNLAAERARGRYLCLLNNDTLLTPGWLSALLRAAEREENLGVLGNLHLYPDSDKVQHSGMGVDPQGKPFHLNPGADPGASSVRYRREFQMVTFACVLIPAGVYRELGGLDEGYKNGFEDCDFCLRAREAGKKVVYTPASRIYHFGQSTPGRTANDDANWLRFHEQWGGNLEHDLARLMEEDREVNRSRPRPSRNRGGLHLSIDLNVANAFLWATVDLIDALHRRGVPMSLPRQPRIHPSVPAKHRKLLKSLMSLHPRETWHVKWTHYWPHHFREPLYGDVNAEFFCTNYRYGGDNRNPDLWMRHVMANEYRKLPVAGYNLDALTEWGIPADRCRVVPLGYSPEIDLLFPAGASPEKPEREELHVLLVTNSHDLHRYGTDLAVKALSQAFGPEDPVVVHLKDYGASTGSRTLKSWIGDCPRFPKVVWHTDFLSKEDLLRLYADMDVQLAPFRGEGFSMKILDAAALGVPTLMPAYGGPLEYSTDGTFLPLRFAEVPVGDSYDRSNHYLGEGATWCEPEVASIVEGLRAGLADRESLRATGRNALRHVRPTFSWDAAAARLMEVLEGWSAEREVVMSTRRVPDTRRMTVIIPTKDREDILARTLDAYEKQTLPAEAYDLLLVNDHGDLGAVRNLAAAHAGLNIRVLDNTGPGGPAAARNLAIEQATGGVVLITGDDIIPEPGFLEEHLKGHERHPEPETAFVGFTDWHPDLPSTPFMRHITGKGGQQFKYDDMKDDHVVPFDRLYTSNCSIKRAFLAEEETLFSTRYRFAAYEDVELGYRLHLRGMKLRHLSRAVGLHHHEMTPESFIGRQRKVGRMLTLLTLQRPGFVPNEHAAFLRALEMYRHHAPLKAHAGLGSLDPEAMVEDFTRLCRAMLNVTEPLARPSGHELADREAALWSAWLERGTGDVWEALNQLVLRLGMAEEWAEEVEDPRAARAWMQLVLLPNVMGFDEMNWNMPFSRPEYTAGLAPDSKLLYRTAKVLRAAPLVGPALHRFEHSPTGNAVRLYLMRLLNPS